MSNLKSVIGTLSIQTIPENALLHGIVKELEGREAFKDADTTNNERFYHGDVFEAILIEQEELCTISKKTYQQLNELAELISADYVLITNT